MSGPSTEKDSPIGGKADLVAFHASGARPPAEWKIGTEHEKFGFRLDDLRPPTYEGPQGISALLGRLAARDSSARVFNPSRSRSMMRVSWRTLSLS